MFVSGAPMPKKTIIRELKSAIEENVRIHSTTVVIT